MMIDAGFTKVTNGEAQFVMNNISRFDRALSEECFEKWAKEMSRHIPKKLIQYSIYFDTTTMKLNTDADFIRRQNAEYQWKQQLRGMHQAEERIPDSLRVLCSEMNALGESFVRKVIKKYSVYDPETNSDLIEFD